MPTMPSTTTPAAPQRGVALALIAALVATLAVAFFAASASANPQKVWVCKYVQQPGEDEVLKGGKNPISVSINATEGQFFKDGQELSYVVSADDGTGAPECPATPPEHEEELPPLPEEEEPTEEPTAPGTDEPTAPGTDDPTAPGTDEPTDEPTAPGTDEPVTQPTTPVAAPSGLVSTQTTGLMGLFAIAASLLGAAGLAIRGARR